MSDIEDETHAVQLVKQFAFLIVSPLYVQHQIESKQNYLQSYINDQAQRLRHLSSAVFLSEKFIDDRFTNAFNFTLKHVVQLGSEYKAAMSSQNINNLKAVSGFLNILHKQWNLSVMKLFRVLYFKIQLTDMLNAASEIADEIHHQHLTTLMDVRTSALFETVGLVVLVVDILKQLSSRTDPILLAAQTSVIEYFEQGASNICEDLFRDISSSNEHIPLLLCIKELPHEFTNYNRLEYLKLQPSHLTDNLVATSVQSMLTPQSYLSLPISPFQSKTLRKTVSFSGDEALSIPSDIITAERLKLRSSYLLRASNLILTNYDSINADDKLRALKKSAHVFLESTEPLFCDSSSLDMLTPPQLLHTWQLKSDELKCLLLDIIRETNLGSPSIDDLKFKDNFKDVHHVVSLLVRDLSVKTEFLETLCNAISISLKESGKHLNASIKSNGSQLILFVSELTDNKKHLIEMLSSLLGSDTTNKQLLKDKIYYNGFEFCALVLALLSRFKSVKKESYFRLCQHCSLDLDAVSETPKLVLCLNNFFVQLTFMSSSGCPSQQSLEECAQILESLKSSAEILPANQNAMLNWELQMTSQVIQLICLYFKIIDQVTDSIKRRDSFQIVERLEKILASSITLTNAHGGVKLKILTDVSLSLEQLNSNATECSSSLSELSNLICDEKKRALVIQSANELQRLIDLYCQRMWTIIEAGRSTNEPYMTGIQWLQIKIASLLQQINCIEFEAVQGILGKHFPIGRLDGEQRAVNQASTQSVPKSKTDISPYDRSTKPSTKFQSSVSVSVQQGATGKDSKKIWNSSISSVTSSSHFVDLGMTNSVGTCTSVIAAIEATMRQSQFIEKIFRGHIEIKNKSDLIKSSEIICNSVKTILTFSKDVMAACADTKHSKYIQTQSSKLDSLFTQLSVVTSVRHSGKFERRVDQIILENVRNVVSTVNDLFSAIESAFLKGLKQPLPSALAELEQIVQRWRQVLKLNREKCASQAEVTPLGLQHVNPDRSSDNKNAVTSFVNACRSR